MEHDEYNEKLSFRGNILDTDRIGTLSFNHVGNAPRVVRRSIVFLRPTARWLPTRLNESFVTANGVGGQWLAVGSH